MAKIEAEGQHGTINKVDTTEGQDSKKKSSLRSRTASSRSGTKADREERRKASSAPSP